MCQVSTPGPVTFGWGWVAWQSWALYECCYLTLQGYWLQTHPRVLARAQSSQGLALSDYARRECLRTLRGAQSLSLSPSPAIL